MTGAERRQATRAVLDWITEAHGDDVASAWAWETTPIPCGVPSDAQLEEGLRLAAGEVTLTELLELAYEHMARYSDVGE